VRGIELLPDVSAELRVAVGLSWQKPERFSMGFITPLASRVVLAVLLLGMVGLSGAVKTAPVGIAPPASVKSPAAIAASVFYPEVRLRKLHLVRPDLIPYPVYYDIYC